MLRRLRKLPSFNFFSVFASSDLEVETDPFIFSLLLFYTLLHYKLIYILIIAISRIIKDFVFRLSFKHDM